MSALTQQEIKRRHTHYYLSLLKNESTHWTTINREFSQIRRAWPIISADNAITLDFLKLIVPFCLRQGLAQECIEWSTRGLQAAKTLGDDAYIGGLLTAIGLSYSARGDLEVARIYNEHARSHARKHNHSAGEAVSLSNLATTYFWRGEWDEALAHHIRALRLQRNLGDAAAQAATLKNIAGIYERFVVL